MRNNVIILKSKFNNHFRHAIHILTWRIRAMHIGMRWYRDVFTVNCVSHWQFTHTHIHSDSAEEDDDDDDDDNVKFVKKNKYTWQNELNENEKSICQQFDAYENWKVLLPQQTSISKTFLWAPNWSHISLAIFFFPRKRKVWTRALPPPHPHFCSTFAHTFVIWLSLLLLQVLFVYCSIAKIFISTVSSVLICVLWYFIQIRAMKHV